MAVAHEYVSCLVVCVATKHDPSNIANNIYHLVSHNQHVEHAMLPSHADRAGAGVCVQRAAVGRGPKIKPKTSVGSPRSAAPCGDDVEVAYTCRLSFARKEPFQSYDKIV